MARVSTWLIGRATGWLVTGVFLSVALLFWFGYHAIQEWRQSALLLAERRSNEAVDLLVEALSRDMRGVQQSVLASQQWQEFAGNQPSEMGSLVASAFARYPYPESFFSWTADQPAGCTGAQLRRFIKSRAYVPMHELRRRFELNGEAVAISTPVIRRSAFVRMN